MLTILNYLLILWGVIAVACLVGWWLAKRRGEEATSGEFTDGIVFVGLSVGLLLSLLQVFAADHYSSARSEAQSEATTLVAMYDNLGIFPPQVATPAQHDLVCYMRSVVGRDWQAQEREDVNEAPDTLARGDRVRSVRTTISPASPQTQAAYSRIAQEVGDAGTSRQKLIFLAEPQIPTVLWAVVFVGVGVLMCLLVSEVQTRQRIIRLAVLIPVILLMSVGVGALATLDHPFSPIARVEPRALTSALALLEAGRHGDPQFADCGPAMTPPS